MKNWTRKISTPSIVGATLLSGLGAPAAQADELVSCSDIAQALARDTQNRLLVGGTAYDNRVVHWENGGHAHYGDLAVSRLLANGEVDRTFGKEGTVLRNVEDFDDVEDVLVRHGSIDVAGTTAGLVGDRRGSRDALVWRLDADGRADATFGADGLVRLDLGGDERPAVIAPAYRGGVYVVGTTRADETADGFVARYTRDGVLDSSFGDNGVVRLDLGSPDDELVGGRAVLDGIVVAGRTVHGGEGAAVVAKLSASGHLDTRFGDGGIARAVIGGAPASGGASSHSLFSGSAVSLAKTLDDGTTRTATVVFDAWGRVRTTPTGSTFELDVPSGTVDNVNAAERYWGSLYLAGSTYPESFATGDAFITRADGDGAPSADFGGVITEHYELEYAAFNDLALDSRGVTAVGWEFSETEQGLPRSDALLVRYGHDGMLDESFGNAGVVLHDFHDGQAVCAPLTMVGGGHDHDHDHDHDDAGHDDQGQGSDQDDGHDDHDH